MKRILNKMLPILLIILVVISIVWYLFVYDRDFTRDMLIDHARYHEEQGNHSIAAWLYNQAYIHSGADGAVAIELAEQFKSIGNYTKAEHTLSGAIADNPSLELYIALCKTYVEQDKLLDAVTMLENIADPQIKEELSDMRPAAPTVNYDPGLYNQYITVSVSAESGTLYLTADGTYPSTELSQESDVTLVGGINTLQAIAVAENGLVSPLATFRYTIGGVIEQIALSDSSIEALIRELLEMDGNKALLTSDLWKIKELTLPELAKSSADLAYLTYLEKLTVSDSVIDTWASLGSLTNLQELHFSNCMLSDSDLQAIASLPNLTKLTLVNCGLTSIESLSEATNLTYLDLNNNAIRDLYPLSGCSKLTYLDLDHNALENLSSVSALSSLQELDVSYNSLLSLAPLSGCTQLQKLNASYNAIVNLTGMDHLTKLTHLDVSNNALTAVDQLGACVEMIELNLSDNKITSIAALSALKVMERLNFDNNNVSALPAFEKDCALIYISGSRNRLNSVASLVGLENLNNVIFDYNNITAVNDLAKCQDLISVSVYGNPVSDVSALREADIIISYTPR